jgi:hypothetical protein
LRAFRSIGECAVLVFLSILVSGCAVSWRGGKVPNEPTWPPRDRSPQKTARVIVNEDWGDTPFAVADLTSQAVAMFSDSRLFWEVIDASSRSDTSAQPDLEIYVHIHHSQRAPWYARGIMGFFTRIVLLTFPPFPPIEHWTDTTEIDVRDAHGHRLGGVTVSDSMTTMTSLYVLPIGLVAGPPTPFDLRRDVLRAAITKAHEQQFF